MKQHLNFVKKPGMYNARCAVVEKCLSGGDPEFPLEMPLPCWSWSWLWKKHEPLSFCPPSFCLFQMEFLVCVSFGLLAHFDAVLWYPCQSLTLFLSPFSPSLLLSPPLPRPPWTADKVNDDFYSKRRHLAELAAKGNLPLHPVRVEDEPRAFSPEHGPAKQNGQKSRTNKTPPHPLAYNSTTNFKGWDPNEQSLRRQAYGNKGKLGVAESGSSDPLGTRTQHYPPPQPYFITNSKTEVTVWAFTTGSILETILNWEAKNIPGPHPSCPPRHAPSRPDSPYQPTINLLATRNHAFLGSCLTRVGGQLSKAEAGMFSNTAEGKLRHGSFDFGPRWPTHTPKSWGWFFLFLLT